MTLENNYGDDTGTPTYQAVITRGERYALLVRCPHCSFYQVKYSFENSMNNNILYGSKRAGLRRCCQGCGSQFRMNSKHTTHILAEVRANRHRAVAALRDVADAANMHSNPASVSRKELYEYYNTSQNYEPKGVPKPFKDWNKRRRGA